jgi:hypothetical protein
LSRFVNINEDDEDGGDGMGSDSDEDSIENDEVSSKCDLSLLLL